MLLLAATLAVALTAVIAAGCLGVSAPSGFLLGAYVLAFFEVVVLSLGLSIFDALTRDALLAGIALVLAAALGAAFVRRPTFPRMHAAAAALRSALRDPPVLVLALVVACGLLYVLAVAVLLPPNDGDAHAYHLARAAFWRQQEAVAYVPDAVDMRLNVNPPNAELGQLFTMLLAPGDRYVGLVQYSALLAGLVAIFGIARRLGIATRPALFGALVFATLPVVALQGSSALNDLVVASFLLAATFFVLGSTRADLALAAIAVGLAVGTKFTAPLLLPLLLLVIALRHPPRRWPAYAAAVAAGLALGSTWYLVNFAETGTFDGDLRHEAEQSVALSFSDIAANALRYVVDALDASGMVGNDAFLYTVPAAILFVAGLLALRRRDASQGVRYAGAALVVLCLPLAVGLLGVLALRSYEKLWVELGRPDLAFPAPTPDFWTTRTVADATASWYGALGVVLPAMAVLLAWKVGPQAGQRALRVGVAAAPFIALALLGLLLVWDQYRGRFFVYPMAMSASVWGLMVARWRGAAWAVAGIASTTLLLTLVHSLTEPTGVSLIEPDRPSSVWSMGRVERTMLLYGKDERDVFTVVERRVPSHSALALAVRGNDPVFPFFGTALDRQVNFVRPGQQPPHEAAWLVRAPNGRFACPEEWTPVDRTGEWMLYRRLTTTACGRR